MKTAYRKSAVTVFCLLFLLCLSGCDSAYKESAKVADDITKGVDSGITITTQLQTSGLITLEERNSVLRYLNKLTDFNGVYKTKVRAIHVKELACQAQKCNEATEYIQAAQELVSAAKDPAVLSLARVQNPAAQAKVSKIVDTINVVLDGAVLAIQKVKG